MRNVDSYVAVRCRISAGGFSSERIFRVTLANGVEYIGAAPVEYFFDESQKRLSFDQPTRGTVLVGLVAARPVDREPNGVHFVSVPSGDVIGILPTQITEYPQERPSLVPVQS